MLTNLSREIIDLAFGVDVCRHGRTRRRAFGHLRGVFAGPRSIPLPAASPLGVTVSRSNCRFRGRFLHPSLPSLPLSRFPFLRVFCWEALIGGRGF